MNLIFVFLGGGLGSLFRYGIAKIFSQNNWDFPLATFLANVISCIVLGYLIGLNLKDGLLENNKLLMMTGFCGGFSTFSTFSAETYQLLQDGNTTLAFLYIGASIMVCIFCIWLGVKLT